MNQISIKKYVEIINAKGKGHFACETNLRAFENYFCPDLITEIFGVKIDSSIKWEEADVPELIAKYNHEKI